MKFSTLHSATPYYILFCLSVMLSTRSFGQTDKPDVSLQVNAIVDSICLNTHFQVLYKVANIGTATVDSVRVSLPTPSLANSGVEVVIDGANPYQSSVPNSFDEFWNNGDWKVGTLQPGQMQWIMVRYFGNTTGTAPFYGQVSYQTADDEDSAPNNGTFPTPIEDDEGVDYVVITPIEFCCGISVLLGNAVCDDQGTPTPVDDAVVMQMLVEGSGTFTGNWLACPEPFAYNGAEVICNSSGQQVIGAFDEPVAAEFNASLAGEQVYVTAPFNSTCVAKFELPDLCKVPEQPNIFRDLDLQLNFGDDTIEANESFRLHVLVRNTGNATMYGVNIGIQIPEGLLYSPGIPPAVVPEGSTYDAENAVWSIDSLVPSTEYTRLRIRFRRNITDSLTFYAQVITSSDNDSDSQPGNGTCCDPNEDDEAVIGAPSMLPNSVIDLDSPLLTLFPNPTGNTAYIRAEGIRLTRMTVTDMLGRRIMQQNTVPDQLDVSWFPAGMYVLQFADRDGNLYTRRLEVSR